MGTEERRVRRSVGRSLRRYFLTGLVVMAPVGLTIYVLYWIFVRVDAVLGTPIEGFLGFRMPGLGFVILVVLVTTIGWAVRRAAGRQLLTWWNTSMVRFPLSGRIYSAVSQVVQSVIGSKQRLFRRTVLVPYPTDGLWVIAFVTNEESIGLSRVVGEPCLHVFVPTTPNPTSGFMLVVPTDRVKNVDMSVEDAMKLVISGGALRPGAAVVGRRGLDLESLLRDTLG
jgi:uncharacterized membrane protein